MWKVVLRSQKVQVGCRVCKGEERWCCERVPVIRTGVRSKWAEAEERPQAAFMGERRRIKLPRGYLGLRMSKFCMELLYNVSFSKTLTCT